MHCKNTFPKPRCRMEISSRSSSNSFRIIESHSCNSRAISSPSRSKNSSEEEVKDSSSLWNNSISDGCSSSSKIRTSRLYSRFSGHENNNSNSSPRVIAKDHIDRIIIRNESQVIIDSVRVVILSRLVKSTTLKDAVVVLSIKGQMLTRNSSSSPSSKSRCVLHAVVEVKVSWSLALREPSEISRLEGSTITARQWRSTKDQSVWLVT